MNIHIRWPNWLQTLCELEDPNSWEFYNVKAQYKLYIKDEREEDFKEQYCPKCLDSFLYLNSLNSNDIRQIRNEKFEQELNKKHVECEVTLRNFESYYLEIMHQKYERFRIVKSVEKHYSVDNVKNIDIITRNLYQEATHSFINGSYLACILAIGSAIDHFVSHLLNPRQKYKDRFYVNGFDEAVNKNLITSALKEEILEFRSVIRHQVAHPKNPSFAMLGMIYNKTEEHWESPDRKPIYTGPRVKAMEGIEIFCKTVSYYTYQSSRSKKNQT